MTNGSRYNIDFHMRVKVSIIIILFNKINWILKSGSLIMYFYLHLIYCMLKIIILNVKHELLIILIYKFNKFNW